MYDGDASEGGAGVIAGSDGEIGAGVAYADGAASTGVREENSAECMMCDEWCEGADEWDAVSGGYVGGNVYYAGSGDVVSDEAARAGGSDS